MNDDARTLPSPQSRKLNAAEATASDALRGSESVFLGSRVRTLVAALVPWAICALILASCAAGPDFATEIRAAAAHLDSGRNLDALGFLDNALGAATDDAERALALAMSVEAHLAADDDEAAARTLQSLRQQAPAAFVTWKTEAVLELHLHGTDAARAALQAAKGVQSTDGQRAWLRDFEALLAGIEAFADGDFATARTLLTAIRHTDVAPAAAFVLGRLDAISRVRETRVSMAQRAGTRAGLVDLCQAAAERPDVQQQIREYARQLGAPLDPSHATTAAGGVPRAHLPASTLGIASAGITGTLVAAQTPTRLRTD